MQLCKGLNALQANRLNAFAGGVVSLVNRQCHPHELKQVAREISVEEHKRLAGDPKR